MLRELIIMNTGTVASKHIESFLCILRVCQSGRCHTIVKANTHTTFIVSHTYMYMCVIYDIFTHVVVYNSISVDFSSPTLCVWFIYLCITVMGSIDTFPMQLDSMYFD